MHPLAGDAAPEKLFESFIVVGARPSLPSEIRSATGWFKKQEELEALVQGLEPELLCLYPPSTDASRAGLFKAFCFPEQFEISTLSGRLPPTPLTEHYVFRMSEGMLDPSPLYGTVVRTQEVLLSSRTNTGRRIHYVAPRCYCLFSRLPLFSALFETLHAVRLCPPPPPSLPRPSLFTFTGDLRIRKSVVYKPCMTDISNKYSVYA